jgi:hypothetical protein
MAYNSNNNNGPFYGVQTLDEPPELHLNERKRNEPVFAPQNHNQLNGASTRTNSARVPNNSARAKGGRRKKHTRRHKKAKRTRRHRKH